jgi:hypothetical protein
VGEKLRRGVAVDGSRYARMGQQRLNFLSEPHFVVDAGVEERLFTGAVARQD